MKKIFSFLLAFAMVLSLVPAASAVGFFTDVEDVETARNVEVLRLLGIVGGDGTGAFHPQSSLNRAEFCKMTILLQQRGDEALRYNNRTVFPDVLASYWACGYINLAAISTTDDPGLMHGYPDGSFRPKNNISFAEAVTVLMRVLGYTDSDSGGIWPQGYLDLGVKTGLTRGLTVDSGAAITRAQAAKLFVNALSTKQKGGGTIRTLGDETLLMSIDPVKGVMLTTDGKTEIKEVPLASSVMSTVFDGLRGRVIYDANNKAVSFLPSPATEVSTGGGSYVTLDPDAFVVVSANKSTAGFDSLTGNSKSYTIVRNGVTVAPKELRKYDVATYDAGNNTVFVCDTRIKACYESAMPNAKAPISIKALGGTDFELLPSARQNVAKYHPGDSFILMLTAEGKVAAVADVESDITSNAVGYVNSAGKVTLFCGASLIALNCVIPENAGRVVQITQGASKTIYLYNQSSRIDGALDIAAGAVGNTKLADGALLIRDGLLTSLSELEESRIDKRQILYTRLNDSGLIDLVVIGDTHSEQIGRVVCWEEKDPEDETGKRYIQYISISSRSGETAAARLTFQAKTGDYAIYKLREDGGFYAYSRLTELGGRSETVTWIGTGAVNFMGITYTVASDVECYNADSNTWFDSLEDALDYGDSLRLFELDGVIRLIEVKH